MEPKLKPKFLEILAHPLRQEILVYIEQEGETGYKDLKNKFNVATGTLYHHLRFLKGLIEQNSNKKYILTDEGRKALNVIFQEEITNDEPVHAIKSINTNSFDNTNENLAITEKSNTTEEVASNQISEIPTIKTTSEEVIAKTTSSVQFTVEKNNSRITFFNINSYVRAIPDWFYKANIGIFIVLPVFLLLIQPKVVFFHFIPIKITDTFYSLIMIIFPAINLIILFFISFLKQEKISLPTLSILVLYYNLVFIFTIILNLLNLLQDDLTLRLFSIVIQGLFIIFWTLSISLQDYSWERSLFLAILQNYILFLFF